LSGLVVNASPDHWKDLGSNLGCCSLLATLFGGAWFRVLWAWVRVPAKMPLGLIKNIDSDKKYRVLVK